MSFIYEDTILFLLIVMRISGIFFFTPFFSSDAINRRVRLGFVVLIAFLLFPVIPKDYTILKKINFGFFLILIFRELLIGLIIGYCMLLIFSTVQIAAQIYGNDMGFGIVNVFDPLSQLQIPVLGQLKYLFMMALFLILGIHRSIIYFLSESFYRFKIGFINYNYNNLAAEMLKNFVYYFEIAVKLSLPILAVLFVTDILLGVMARIAPQMNVFFIGMPLKILIGFLFLIAFVPYFTEYIEYIFDDGYKRIIKSISYILKL